MEVEPEQIIEEAEIEEEREAPGGAEMRKHLRANLLDYPELLQPEIKKNLDVITKQEAIIMKNEGNAKKTAQEKVRKAKEVIGRAQASVNDYVDDLVKQYNTSHNLLMETSRTLFGEQKPGKRKAAGGLEKELNVLYQKYFGRDKAYSTPKNSIWGNIKGSFEDRKIRKTMGPDWDEFQVKRSEYRQKLDYYNNLLASHAKRFGRLEEVSEAGTAYHPKLINIGTRNLPSVRGH